MLSFMVQNHQLHISGELLFDTVLMIREQGLNFLQNEENPVFNFETVTKADSASIALLLEWWKAAEKLKKKIQFLHLPSSMLALVKVSNLENILAGSLCL